VWNNLVQQNDEKTGFEEDSRLLCPTSQRPYLSTKRNSGDEDKRYTYYGRRRRRRHVLKNDSSCKLL